MAHAGFSVPGTGANECIVFLVPGWVLDTPLKYAFATLGAFCLAFGIELMAWIRHKYPTYILVKLFTASTQVVLCVFCMLLLMTYAVALLIGIVLGIISGKLLAGVMATHITKHTDKQQMGLDSDSAGSERKTMMAIGMDEIDLL